MFALIIAAIAVVAALGLVLLAVAFTLDPQRRFGIKVDVCLGLAALLGLGGAGYIAYRVIRATATHFGWCG